MSKQRRGAIGMRWPHVPPAILRELQHAHQERVRRVAKQLGVSVPCVRRVLQQYCREFVADLVQDGAACIPPLGVWRWVPFKRHARYFRDSRWWFSSRGGWLSRVHKALESGVEKARLREFLPDSLFTEHAILGLLRHVPGWEIASREALSILRQQDASVVP